MTYILLSERLKNAERTCEKCQNLKDNGSCKYPVLIARYFTTKLINFSEDGLTCQLFRRRKNDRD